MLYTLSQAHYNSEEFDALLAQLTNNDALIFWQDGVLQGVRSWQKCATLPNVFFLENDLQARGFSLDLPAVSLDEFVRLTERFFPQVAL